MKITKSQLKQIIKEELSKVLSEEIETDTGVPAMSPEEIEKQQMRKDLMRVVMIAYDIDRKITPENTELMREIDSIIEKYDIEFNEGLE